MDQYPEPPIVHFCGQPVHGIGKTMAVFNINSSAGRVMSAIRVLIGELPPMLQSMLSEVVKTERDIVLIDPMAAAQQRNKESDSNAVNVVLMSNERFSSTTTTLGDIASLVFAGENALDRTARHTVIIHSEQRDWSASDTGQHDG
jgi:hypothetical protein